MTIDTLSGDLRAVAQLEKGTLQHWDELSIDQTTWVRDDVNVIYANWFFVADFPLYSVDKGKPILFLARHTKEHPNNLALVHLCDSVRSSYDQLKDTGTFLPDIGEAQAVLQAADTLKIEMASLRLSEGNEFCSSLNIRTSDGFVFVNGTYQKSTDVEEALKQRAGYTERFLSVLNKEHDISRTRLFTLNPNYVIAQAGEKFIGQVAWRWDFKHGLDSYTFPYNCAGMYYGNVGSFNCFPGSMRGIRR